MTRLRTSRAVAGLVAAAALALTGCSATNPITTLGAYDASDGAGIEFADLRAQNLLVVAEAEGAAGVLSGALVNGSSDEQDVTISVTGGAPVEITLGGGDSVLLGVSDAPARYATLDVPVAAVDTPPGGLTTVTIATSRGGSAELRVPVLDGTLPEYAALLESVTAAPTPDETPAATPTSTATPADETPDASAPEGEETQED